MSNTDIVITPVVETEHEIFVRTALALQMEKLDRIEEKVEKIYTVLDIAFSRFDAMSKSPLLGSLFGAMTKGKSKEKENG
jgi:hypothetical protein